MKVHNYGSDYAYQQKLKQEAEDKPVLQPIVETLNSTDNVENQLPSGGETAVATADVEAGCDSNSEKAPETKKRKKKEKAIDCD